MATNCKEVAGGPPISTTEVLPTDGLITKVAEPVWYTAGLGIGEVSLILVSDPTCDGNDAELVSSVATTWMWAVVPACTWVGAFNVNSTSNGGTDATGGLIVHV